MTFKLVRATHISKSHIVGMVMRGEGDDSDYYQRPRLWRNKSLKVYMSILHQL